MQHSTGEVVTGEVVIACCQEALVFGDVAANLARLERAVRDAAAAGAQIVVLPELANTGYMFADAGEARSLAEPSSGATVGAWRRLAAELHIVLVAGFLEAGDDGMLYNSAVLIEGAHVKAIYRKVHLWDREADVFCAASGAPPVVDTEFGRIGVVICYDLEFPEWVRSVALAGAELLAAPVNWPLYPRPRGERPAEIVRSQANASVNRVFVAVCDRVGRERDQEWLGGSAIIDADGFPRSAITLGEPHTAIARVDLSEARNKKISEHNDVFTDRRPSLYGSAAG